jgi:hypothetical protein
MSFKSQDYYKKVLDEIISLTIKPTILKKKIISAPLNKSTAINLAVDIIIKYLVYYSNPRHSVSHDTTITKHGTVIRIARDPLEFIINSYSRIDFSKQKISPKEWLNKKMFWIDFLTTEIIDPLMNGKPKSIKIKSLEFFLVDFFQCQSDQNLVANDLYNILNKLPINIFKNSHNVINPSFHHVNDKLKHFSTQADIILDKTLIDIKNVKELEFTMDNYRQLLYYFFWTNLEIDEGCFRFNQVSGCYSENIFSSNIDNLGIYYSRFNYMFKFNIRGIWKDKDGYENAKEIFLSGLKNKYFGLPTRD